MSDITYEPFDLDAISDVDRLDSATSEQALKKILHTVFDMDGPNANRLMGVCLGLGAFLARKNKAYGDSALKPMRVFSSASSTEQLRVRIDDKLSRIARGELAGEDAVVDLAGYLVLLLASREDAQP